MTIVVCYSPTDVAEIEEKDRFYKSFEDVLQRLHPHDLQMVVGDFNARVDTDRNGFELFLGPHAVAESAIDNGQRLLDTCEQLCHWGKSLPPQVYSPVHLFQHCWNTMTGTIKLCAYKKMVAKILVGLSHLLGCRYWQ